MKQEEKVSREGCSPRAEQPNRARSSSCLLGSSSALHRDSSQVPSPLSAPGSRLAGLGVHKGLLGLAGRPGLSARQWAQAA